MSQQVAIIGLGLMGGSLGLALKRQEGFRVTAYARREETRREAMEQGAADAVFDRPADAARGADLVVLCVPVMQIPAMLEACRPGLKAGAVVTDVGSTKAWLAETCAAALTGTGALFIGSHPVAGSERQGIEAARADLYDGAVTVVTPPSGALGESVAQVVGLWEAAGSRVVCMPPERHDALIARTSHLPHLAAAALALAVGRGDQGEMVALLCGPGFRDTTRIAMGSPAMWHDILRTNRVAILQELTAMRDGLDAWTRLLQQEDFEGARVLLEQGREVRKRLTDGAVRAGEKDHDAAGNE